MSHIIAMLVGKKIDSYVFNLNVNGPLIHMWIMFLYNNNRLNFTGEVRKIANSNHFSSHNKAWTHVKSAHKSLLIQYRREIEWDNFFLPLNSRCAWTCLTRTGRKQMPLKRELDILWPFRRCWDYSSYHH